MVRELLNKVWTTFWVRSPKATETLADILSNPDNRESLLGFRREAPQTQDGLKRDLTRIIRYSNSEDYGIWSKEAWAMAVSLINQLTKESESVNADFYRGALSSTLDLLRLSHKARHIQKEMLAENKNSVLGGHSNVSGN